MSDFGRHVLLKLVVATLVAAAVWFLTTEPTRSRVAPRQVQGPTAPAEPRRHPPTAVGNAGAVPSTSDQDDPWQAIERSLADVTDVD